MSSPRISRTESKYAALLDTMDKIEPSISQILLHTITFPGNQRPDADRTKFLKGRTHDLAEEDYVLLQAGETKKNWNFKA